MKRHVLITSLLVLVLTSNACFAWNPFKAKAGVDVEVTAPYTELYTGPGRGFPRFHVAERGEKLRVFKRMTDWYQVETENGQIGWVKRKDLDGSLSSDGSLADFSGYSKEAFENRKWELGVTGGNFSGAESVNMYLSYHLTQNIVAELNYTQAFGEFSNVKVYRLSTIHQPWPEWRISPFFTLGAGNMQTFPNAELVETEDREDSILTVGGGFFIYVAKNFLFRLEYDNHTVLTTRTDNEEVFEWKAGFSVFF